MLSSFAICIAAIAALNKTVLILFLPPFIFLLPLIFPLSQFIGTTPIKAQIYSGFPSGNSGHSIIP
jgi:hypothetical protein